MSSYTSWFKDGTASVVNGTTAVTGVDTYWSTAGIHAGDLLTFDDGLSFAEIASVNSDTSITLARPFTRGTIANATYAIIRNFTSGSLPEVASQVVDALGKYTRYFNEDIATLNGKSAYEVALEHGYSGTKAQWLESLKAANEWSTLNNRTNILTYNNAAAHNSYYRGKNLGTAITAAQMETIRTGKFDDIYPGDSWWLTIDGNGFQANVVGINHYFGQGYFLKQKWTNHAVVWLRNPNWVFTVNDTATTTGGLLNSKLYTETLPALLAKIEQIIPPEYILSWPCSVCDAVDSSGSPNHYTNTEQRIFLPSEMEIYGMHTVKEGYQGHNKMWPYSHYASGYVAGWQNIFWLDAPSNATAWCSADRALFNLNTPPANHPEVKVWPYILIGKEDS